MTLASAGYNTLFKRGDGGVGAAVQASRTIGASNSQIVIKAKAGVAAVAGSLGNTLSCQIVVAGNNTALSVSVSGSGANTSLTVNSATNGSAVATSTINDIIAAIDQAAGADAWFDATSGAGNGTGVLAAAASLAFLTGGSDGAEVFTSVLEVKQISFGGLKLDTADATHMESPSAFREKIATIKDGGEVSITGNFLPGQSNHQGITTDFKNRTLRNFKVTWSDSGPTSWNFSAYVNNIAPQSSFDGELSWTIGLMISGAPTLP